MKRYQLLIIVLLISTVPQHAYAYLDPGTGSMALQLMVAGLLGALFTIKTWWRSIIESVKGLFSKSAK